MHHPVPSIIPTRRDFLRATSCGFGSLALSAMLQQQAAAETSRDDGQSPLTVKQTHFPPRAKRIIFLFMSGGPSQMDLCGIAEKQTDQFGRQCLLARRFAEAGVRFVQVSLGGWDHHGKIATGLPDRCTVSDKPNIVIFLVDDMWLMDTPTTK